MRCAASAVCWCELFADVFAAVAASHRPPPLTHCSSLAIFGPLLFYVSSPNKETKPPAVHLEKHEAAPAESKPAKPEAASKSAVPETGNAGSSSGTPKAESVAVKPEETNARQPNPKAHVDQPEGKGAEDKEAVEAEKKADEKKDEEKKAQPESEKEKKEKALGVTEKAEQQKEQHQNGGGDGKSQK